MPRLSIVVVTYDARAFLPDLLESLERQTFRDTELIVVDNASRDDTRAFLRERAPEARVFPLETNTGFFKKHALTEGMKAALPRELGASQPE